MALRPCPAKCAVCGHGIWQNPWDDSGSNLFDRYFSNIIPPQLGYPRFMEPLCPRHSRKIRVLQPTGVPEVVNNDKEYRIIIDVRHFKPDEISVKTRQTWLIIHAHHEDREDGHGLVQRAFKRQYILPVGVDPASVTSFLSKDGMLTIGAPKNGQDDSKERVVPITQDTREK